MSSLIKKNPLVRAKNEIHYSSVIPENLTEPRDLKVVVSREVALTRDFTTLKVITVK